MLDQLLALGETQNDEDMSLRHSLCQGHINMLDHYSFTLAELMAKGHLRPLKDASEAENNCLPNLGPRHIGRTISGRSAGANSNACPSLFLGHTSAETGHSD